MAVYRETTIPLVSVNEATQNNVSGVEKNHYNNQNHLHPERRFQKRESILASQISLYVDKEKPKIPDGGWGWFVVLASFLINMISDGVGYTFGLLYIEFLHEFKASKSATSWIGSLFVAIPLITGPIGSALVDRYGCQWMTIIGGIICTIGLVASSYVKSIGWMYLTFGVIGGMGLCLCFVTAVVSIAFWFDNKRTLAMSLAASGTGFGTAVYSPLATWFLYLFGWRGTLLITAGFFANICVCGALMRDPDWIIEEDEKEEEERKLRKRKESSVARLSICIEDIKETLQKGGDAQYLLENIDTTLDLSEKNRVTSSIDLPTFLKQNETVPLEVLQHLSENKQLYRIILENYPNLLSGRSVSDQGINLLMTDAPTRVPVQFSMKVKKTEDNFLEKPEEHDVIDVNTNHETNLLNNNIKNNPTIPHHRGLHEMRGKNQPQPRTYLKNIRFRKNSIGYRGAMLNLHKYKVKASSCPNIYRNSMAKLHYEEETWCDEIMDILKDLTNFSLFMELHFLLLSISTIVLCIWFVVPYFYLADHMTNIGYTEADASYVLSVIGITNTLGMIILGWAGDKFNVAKFVAVCLILCGMSVGAIIFFSTNYLLLVISSGFFGFFFASCLSLTPSLMTELVCLDDFTMAYGLVLLCEGIGNLTGPPVAALLYDLTDSWEQSFYQSAFWIIISGVLIGIIPYTKNKILFGTGILSIDKEDDDD